MIIRTFFFSSWIARKSFILQSVVVTSDLNNKLNYIQSLANYHHKQNKKLLFQIRTVTTHNIQYITFYLNTFE